MGGTDVNVLKFWQLLQLHIHMIDFEEMQRLELVNWIVNTGEGACESIRPSIRIPVNKLNHYFSGSPEMTPRSCSSFCHLIFHIKLGFHILERGILSCTDCGQTFGLDPRNKISNMSNIFTSTSNHVWSQSLNILIYIFSNKIYA